MDPTAPGAGCGRRRVLLVDDDPAVLHGLSLHLRRNYDVVMRTSGAAGLEAIEEASGFDAVISDLKMPQMNGVQFLAEVRRRFPGTTRVLLTGYADVNSAVTAVNEAGVHCFLTKPCPPAELAAALERALASTAGARNVTVDEQMARLGRQATLGTMAGAIGHEMRTLVAALSSSLDDVRSQVDRGESPTSESVGLMVLLKNRLHEHTTVLLDLARPRRMRIEVVDVSTIVCGAVGLVEKAGLSKIAKPQIELPFTALQVEADRALLEGAIINLLKNASEALAETQAPVITIRVVPRGEEALAIIVEDNGPGVPSENLEHLFMTYFTTKGGSGGTGFGLAIARETIEHHGGRISVASTVGQGTAFMIELPQAGCRSLTKRTETESAQGRVLKLVPRRP